MWWASEGQPAPAFTPLTSHLSAGLSKMAWEVEAETGIIADSADSSTRRPLSPAVGKTLMLCAVKGAKVAAGMLLLGAAAVVACALGGDATAWAGWTWARRVPPQARLLLELGICGDSCCEGSACEE